MPTAADIKLQDIGNGGLMYSITPHDGSEALSVVLDSEGNISVFDNDGEYSRVLGTEKTGVNVEHGMDIMGDNIFYEPEGNMTIRVFQNDEGKTEIELNANNNQTFNVVPEDNLGRVARDNDHTDDSPGVVYDISTPLPSM